MTETVQEKKSESAEATPEAAAPPIKDMPPSGFYATGRRKDAVARVWLRKGKGTVMVNHRSFETYFARPVLRMVIAQPLELVGVTSHYDVFCTVKGGGLSGQAGAVRHGIARALAMSDDAAHSQLRRNGFLTRDARVVERKKYGRHKARRSHQFSKR